MIIDHDEPKTPIYTLTSGRGIRELRRDNVRPSTPGFCPQFHLDFSPLGGSWVTRTVQENAWPHYRAPACPSRQLGYLSIGLLSPQNTPFTSASEICLTMKVLNPEFFRPSRRPTKAKVNSHECLKEHCISAVKPANYT
jgi:hypothetical protein